MNEELRFAGFNLKEWEDIGFVKCVGTSGEPFSLTMTAWYHDFSIDMIGVLYLNEVDEHSGVSFKNPTPSFVKQLIEALKP